MFYRLHKQKTAVVILLLMTLLLASCHNSVIPSTEEQVTDISETTTVEEVEDSTSEALSENPDSPSLVIGSVFAEAGKTVDVNVNVVNNPGVAGALIQFEFDEGLELVNAEPGQAFSVLDFTPPGRFENKCRFSWDSESGMSKEDGIILTLSFKTPKTAVSGDVFNIGCSYKIGDVYNEELNDVDLVINNGKITIQ